MNNIEPRWLSATGAARYISVGMSTFYRLRGSLPDPVYLSARMPRWDRLALDRMLAGDNDNALLSLDADSAFSKAADALKNSQI